MQDLEKDPTDSDGDKWSSAVCAAGSDSELAGKTRGEAKLKCAENVGQPDLSVDDSQACSCCDVMCGPNSDPELMSIKSTDALYKCQSDHPWGSKLHFSETRDCHCQCVGGKTVWEEKAVCTGSGHTFEACGQCKCNGDGSKYIHEEREACERVGGHFDHASCDCKCSGASGKSISHESNLCSSKGYTFDLPQCGCLCQDKTPVSEKETSCTSGAGGPNHEFVTVSSGNKGLCKCTCKTGHYIGQPLDEAANNCKKDGGRPSDSDPCICNCKSNSDLKLHQAQSSCESQGLFFLNDQGQCKCTCSSASYDMYKLKTLDEARTMCAAPLKLEFEHQACNCYCPNTNGASGMHKRSEARLDCEDFGFRFKDSDCACVAKPDTPYYEPDTPRDIVVDKCAAKGGNLVVGVRCLCPSSNIDLNRKEEECKKAGDNFDAPSCACVCKPGPHEGKAVITMKRSCDNEGGIFDNPSCSCLCASHDGIFHGNKMKDGFNTVAAAKQACEGNFKVEEGGACKCVPLKTEPCCKDGSGVLITVARQVCKDAGGILNGDAADCKCSVATTIAPSRTLAPSSEVTADASGKEVSLSVTLESLELGEKATKTSRDVRSGNPNTHGVITLQDSVDLIVGSQVVVTFKYVTGYGCPGKTGGAHFHIKIDGKNLGKWGPYEDYPYDNCGGTGGPDKYSPLQTLTIDVDQAMSGRPVFAIANNNRNIHIKLESFVVHFPIGWILSEGMSCEDACKAAGGQCTQDTLQRQGMVDSEAKWYFVNSHMNKPIEGCQSKGDVDGGNVAPGMRKSDHRCYYPSKTWTGSRKCTTISASNDLRMCCCPKKHGNVESACPLPDSTLSAAQISDFERDTVTDHSHFAMKGHRIAEKEAWAETLEADFFQLVHEIGS